MSDLFNELYEKIQNFYDQDQFLKGKNSGGRFLVCSRENIIQNNGIVFIGENPGGEKARSKIEGYVEVSPFREESKEKWDSSLQVELPALFNRIFTHSVQSVNQIIDKALISNFIFFRSANLKELQEGKFDRIEDFCRSIWRRILFYNIDHLKLLICSGLTAWKNMREILNYFPDADTHPWEEYSLKYQGANRKIWLKTKQLYSDQRFIMTRIPNLTDRNVNALGGGIFNSPSPEFSGELDRFCDLIRKFCGDKK